MTPENPDDDTPPADDDRFGDFEQTANPQASAPGQPPPALRSTSDPDLQAKYRRRKTVTKSKKKIDTTTEWEGDEASPPEKPAAEAPPVDHEGMEKKRRSVAKKKRIATNTEKIFLKTPKFFFALLVVLIAVIAAIVVVGLPKVAMTSPEAAIKAAERSAEEAAQNLDPVVAKLLPTHPTDAEFSAVEDAISRYLGADGWEAKLAFVRRADAVAPLMERFYALADNRGTDGPKEIAEILLRRKLTLEDKTIFTYAVQVAPDLKIQFFAVEQQSAERYKVDWEVSEAYQPMSLAEFKTQRPTTPVQFRVQAKPSDYFNTGFDSPDTYDSFELSYPGQQDFKLFGYAEKGTNGAAEMFVVCPPGRSISLIVTLRFPDDPQTDNQVLIDSVVRADWFLD